jgi:hypothetical protein
MSQLSGHMAPALGLRIHHMPYLNIDLDYFEHRKTRRLIVLLGRGAEVLPIRLWAYCGKFHSEDGKLTGYSDQEIESAAGWWGKPGEMLDGLRQAGYMTKEGKVWSMKNWLEHQGHIAAFRARGKMMAERRWFGGKRHAASNAVSITASNAVSNAPTDQPIQPTDRPTTPRDVELPPGFPQTEAEGRAHAGFVGCSDDFAAKIWQKASGRGGRDSHDVPIRNWRSYLASEWGYERERIAKNGGGVPSSQTETKEERHTRMLREAL